ncbi:Phosphatidylethanolamine-binding protein family protein [Prunus dulcis]|uniref:Phosphatidylethanolamine-binding protein family protein n=1 Tax=Prunus dulcis TaxID=3755 RepID=A0A4Y1RSF6_PRUDU|nr:Phosphatidylethanolamine-binding protein family protein [Prunus dulcis]
MPRDRDPLVVGRVVGDVLDPFTRSVSLRVTYGMKEVNNGCELKPSQVVQQPRVDTGGDDLRTFYTWSWWILMHPAQKFVLSQLYRLTISSPFGLSNFPSKLRFRVQIFIPFSIKYVLGKEYIQTKKDLLRKKKNVHSFIPGWLRIYQQQRRQALGKRLCVMKAHGQRWGFIALFWCYFGNWVGKQCMLRGGAKTLILETLRSFTILDYRYLPSILTAKGRAALEEGEDN